MVAYRKHWKAGPKHFDYKRGDNCNPRRFALVGRPQIGKTGAYLHFVYLMWKAITANAVPDQPPIKPPVPIATKVKILVRKQIVEPETIDENMGEFPNYEIMEAQKLDPKKNSPGKYGDRSDLDDCVGLVCNSGKGTEASNSCQGERYDWKTWQRQPCPRCPRTKQRVHG